MKQRILFVDDEPRVLEGLERMLRRMRDEWEMGFAESGREALNILSKKGFEVIVSDMRMPGMDGAQLLEEVRKRHPAIVRIVLSGHSDREMILKSVLPAHQYLSKPCDAETLKNTVARACALRKVLTDNRLMDTVSQMSSLPSLPSLYAEIMTALRSENTSVQKVGDIISKDVGMTAKILQMVNSAFFGIGQHVSSPTQAATLLGLDLIKALVLSVQIFSEFDHPTVAELSLKELWGHSMMTGTCARAIANQEGANQNVRDEAFTAGILHDVGKLVTSSRFLEKYKQALVIARAKNIPFWEAEIEIFGTSHGKIGAYLTGLWGLSDSIVEAIAFHHSPNQCIENDFSPLTAVHVANALVQEIHILDKKLPTSKIDSNYLVKLGLLDRLPAWRNASQDVLKREETDDP